MAERENKEMNHNGVICVIVPVYKVEPYISRCVDSILNQSYSDFELILIDDGSPDGCGAICDEYAENDSRIHVIHQENGGLSAARNAGIDWAFRYTSSQWLTFVDSDDWVHKDYLNILMDTAIESGTSVAMCNYIGKNTIEQDETIVLPKLKTVSFRQGYCEYYSMCMTACCKIYKRSLWETLRFPVKKLHEDAYITHFPLIDAGKFSLREIPLYYYFSNDDSITRASWTPRRLDQIDAHEQRLSFWKKEDYEDCFIRELQVYIEALTMQLRQIQETRNVSYEVYQCSLQKKLRKALREARKMGLFPFEEKYWGEYTLAYPKKIHRRLMYVFLRITRNN